MLWECPKLFKYWTKILKTLKDAFNIDIDTDPLLAIFGLTVDVNISVTVQKALAFTTLLARRLILLKWKHVSPPSFDTWICCSTNLLLIYNLLHLHIITMYRLHNL